MKISKEDILKMREENPDEFNQEYLDNLSGFILGFLGDEDLIMNPQRESEFHEECGKIDILLREMGYEI